MVFRRHSAQEGPLLAQTRRLLQRYGLHARKGLAQHFLVDDKVLELVVEAAELTPNDVVIEVGPGLGILTRELAKEAGTVVSVELDERLSAVLKKTQGDLYNVIIVNGDILKLDPVSLLEENFLPASGGYKLVANLPYYITSLVLRHFLEAAVRPQMMVVMVQKEVAEAVAARPGRMSLLSVSVQLYGEPTIVGHVPAQAFYPAPEVDSTVLKIDVYPEPRVVVGDVSSFFAMVRAGFSVARKQLANSLANGLEMPKEKVVFLLKRADIEPKRRAETLTLEEWARLRATLTEMEGE